nr:rhodanese-like domain-containing protein [Patulibacter sp. SYSU D01012]
MEPRAGAAGAVAGRDDVRTLLGDPDALLLDARSPEEYRGERVSPADFPVDHGAVRAGRIPGARHLPHRALLDGRGRFLPAARLRTVAADAGATAAGPVVAYCRLGHRASLAWFALHELLGIPDVRVYDGSWTEWGSVVGVPIER